MTSELVWWILFFVFLTPPVGYVLYILTKIVTYGYYRAMHKEAADWEKEKAEQLIQERESK